MADDAGNLDIQKSINDAIAARAGMLSKQTDIMKGQVAVAMELCKALKCEDLEGMSDRIQSVTTALAAAQKEAGSTGTSLTAAAAAAGELAGKTTEAGKNAKAQSKSYKSLGDVIGNAFINAGAQIDATLSLLSSFTTGIYGIGSALLSIPLTVFSVIMESASELANSTSALAQAMEKVRATFGDLSKAEGAQVIGTFDQLDAQSSNLAGTGLSLSKVFGSGPEGLAAAMEAVAATAEAMGPVFGVLSDEFATAGAEIMMLQKGLGLTGEAMKGIGSYALSMGESMEDTLMQNANLALQMGEKFGVSSKLIAQDLGYMQSNMGKFGSVTKTQMSAAATYVRKLGMEIKDIEGLLGAFDDFETAATSASKLAQAFGMNVDAMQMMQEQDPAKRLDMLRQSFAATGKSIENMSRQEKALLAQSAGLDENTVSLALSTENMGLSYEEVMAGAEEAADSQKSEAEIMLDVAENIERVIENLTESTSSFFETFLNGFMKGISRTEEFKEMQRALAAALQKTFQFGMEIGKMFVELFPGIKEMMGGLADIFDPERFQKLIDDLKSIFMTFFTDLSKDPVKAVENFMEKIQEKFFDFFNPKGTGGAEFISGLKKFGTAIIGGLAGLGGYLIKALTGAIKDLAAFIRGDGLSDVGDAASEGIGALLSPFIEVLKELGPPLGAALLDLIGTIMKEYGPQIALVLSGYLAANLAAGFASSVASVGKSAVTEMAKEKLKGLLTSFTTPKMPEPKGDGGAGQVGALGGVVEAFNKINMGKVAKAIVVAALAAVFAAGALVAFAEAVAYSASVLANTKMEDIAKVFASTVIGVVAVGGLALAASFLLADGGVTLAIGTLGLLAGAAFAVAGIPIFAFAVKMAAGILADVPFESVVKTFASLGLALIATAGLAVVGALVGATLATAGPLVVLGLIAGAKMLKEGVMIFGAALADLVNDFPDIPLDRVAKIMLLTVGAVISSAAIAGVGAIAGAAAPGLLLAAFGIKALSKFLVTTMGDIGGAIQFIASIPMGDPKEMASRMEVVAGLVNSLTAFAGLAVDAAQMAIISEIMGGGGIQETIASLSSFMQQAVSSIISLVSSLVEIASKWDEAMLTKVEAVAKLMGAIGTLAGALAAPMQTFASVEGEWFGDSATEKMDKIMTGIERVMDKMTEKLPDIVKQVAGIPLGGLTPEKADTLSKVMGGIASITSALTDNAKAMQGGEIDPTKMAANFELALTSVGSALTGLQAKMPAIAASVEALTEYKELSLGGTVTAIIEDIKAVNDALAEIGEIDINATIGKLGDALSLKSEVLKIENKPIEMQVNLNLTMRAEDIAKEIFDVTAKMVKDPNKASDGQKEIAGVK